MFLLFGPVCSLKIIGADLERIHVELILRKQNMKKTQVLRSPSVDLEKTKT